MFNLLKSDAYRLMHGKMLWALTVALLVFVAGAVGLVWFGTTPEFAQMVNEQAAQNMADSPGASGELSTSNDADLTGEEVAMLNDKSIDSRTYAYGQTFVTGGVLNMLAALFAALFLVSDFDTGFVKSVFAGRARRASYFAEKLVLCGAACALFLLVGMLAVDASYAIAGFSIERVEPMGEYWAWAGLAWLNAMAYVLITAVVAWATRSKAAAVAAAVVVAGGIAASLIMLAAQALAPAFPMLVEAVLWLPRSCTRLLGSGALDLFSSSQGVVLPGLAAPGHIALVSCAVISACAALSLTACKRRDV